MFFDDNIEPHSDARTNIVGPIGKNADIDDLIKRCQLVQVDTLAAINDEHYFVRKLEESLQIRAQAQTSPRKDYEQEQTSPRKTGGEILFPFDADDPHFESSFPEYKEPLALPST
jgi:hypothetical protein